MPEPLCEDEIEEIVDDVIAEVGATSMRDIGRVMADVMRRSPGRADRSAVSQLVRDARPAPVSRRRKHRCSAGLREKLA